MIPYSMDPMAMFWRMKKEHFYGTLPHIHTKAKATTMKKSTWKIMIKCPIAIKIFFSFFRNDPDALVEIEPEMDLEIQLAFKDFVKSK